MADQQVVFELNGKDAGVVRAWMNAKNSVAAYEAALAKIDGAQAKNSKSAKGWDSAMGGVIKQFAGIAAGGLSVGAAVSSVSTEMNRAREATLKFLEESEEAFRKTDKLNRRLQVTAGLGPLAAKDMQKQLSQVGQETATKNSDVTEIALGLSSAGAATEDIVGGTKSIASFINAQALGDDANVEQLTDALTGIILAQGKRLTQESIDKVTSQIQSRSVKDTKFKVTDLDKWAKEASALKKFGGMTQEDIISIAAVNRNEVDAATASNQLKELTKNMAISGGKKDATQALKTMGLKPQDIDMVGEDWMTAFDRLQKGLEKLPEDKRMETLTKIVEGSNVGRFTAIIEKMDEIKGVKSGLAETDLPEDAGIMQSGINAGGVRLNNQLEDLDANRQAYAKLYRDSLEAELKTTDSTPNYVKRRLAQYDTMVGRGARPEEATRSAGGILGISSGLTDIGGSGLWDAMFENGDERERVNRGAEKRFIESVGGVSEATKIRGVPSGTTIEDTQSRGEAYAKHYKQYSREGNTELAEEARRNMEIQHEILRTLKEQNRLIATGKGQNVQVVMPGSGAPAKPVAAAGIGANRP